MIIGVIEDVIKHFKMKNMEKLDEITLAQQKIFKVTKVHLPDNGDSIHSSIFIEAISSLSLIEQDINNPFLSALKKYTDSYENDEKIIKLKAFRDKDTTLNLNQVKVVSDIVSQKVVYSYELGDSCTHSLQSCFFENDKEFLEFKNTIQVILETGNTPMIITVELGGFEPRFVGLLEISYDE